MRPIERRTGVRKILVRGTNWIGDAVMSVPALKEIRRLFPQAEVSLLVRPWVKDVYSAVDFVDEIIEYDKRGAHQGWSGLRRIVHEIRQRRFDLAILSSKRDGGRPDRLVGGHSRTTGLHARRSRSVSYSPMQDRPRRAQGPSDLLLSRYPLGCGTLAWHALANGAYRPSVDVQVRDADAAAARELLDQKRRLARSDYHRAESGRSLWLGQAMAHRALCPRGRRAGGKARGQDPHFRSR